MIFNPSIYWSDVLRAARAVAKSYMRFEVPDIAQAIMLDMCESPQRYERIGGKLFQEALRRAGYRYCQNEASRLLEFDDEYNYSAHELAALLGRYYEPASWPNGWRQPDWGDYEDVDTFRADLDVWSEKTAIVIDLFDVEAALNKLRPIHRKVIEKRYRDRERLSGYEAKVHSNALRLVTFYVNESAHRQYRNIPWDYEGPGARKALSNDSAIARTSYEGGFEADSYIPDALQRYNYERA
ncbi:hypothetical protein [Nonomuraea zeae]|uniref:hypothetical protein n=1 Tax=Nonomuraea zeae TaxID=1642303 RepID=UPI00361E1E09